jgi:hypothetical protein
MLALKDANHRLINKVYKGENPLRCITHDEKGLFPIIVIFYLIFFTLKNDKSKFSKGLYFRSLQF